MMQCTAKAFEKIRMDSKALRAYARLFLLLGLLPTLAFAGDYAGDFLTEGVGARAMGLGGAFAGVADDATASYWNPAGLALVETVEASFMRSVRTSGLGSFDHLAIANLINPHVAVGLSWIHFGLGDIPIYEALPENIPFLLRRNSAEYRPSFEPASVLSNSEDAFVLTGAARYQFSSRWWDNMGSSGPPPEVMAGLNLKRLRHSLLGNSAGGTGFDLSLLVRFLDGEALTGFGDFGGISAGLNIQDVGGTKLKWNTPLEPEDEIPANVKLGIAYVNDLEELDMGITLSYEYNSRYEGTHNVGAEYRFADLLAFRLGIRDGDFTAGTGVRINKIWVDYAFLSYELGTTHRVGMMAQF